MIFLDSQVFVGGLLVLVPVKKALRIKRPLEENIFADILVF
jgi:hypothetical protein